MPIEYAAEARTFPVLGASRTRTAIRIDGASYGHVVWGKKSRESRRDPWQPRAAFSARTLQPTIDGIYEADVGSDPVFDPPAGHYTVVVDATRNDAVAGHWERGIEVVVSS